MINVKLENKLRRFIRNEIKLIYEGVSYATYYNKHTKKTYKLMNVNDLAHAWRLADFVSKRNNWNPDMFSDDIVVTFIQGK